MDPKTLAPAVGLVALQFLLYAAGWAIGARLLREHRAVMAHWAGFMACAGLGFLLMSQRGEPRGWLAYNGAAVLWAGSLLLLWRGVAHYFHAPSRTRLQQVLFVALLVGHAWLGPAEPQAAQRVLASYGTGLLICLLLIANVMPATQRRLGPAQSLLLTAPAFILVAVFATLLLRQLTDLSLPQEMHRFDGRNIQALAACLVAAALFNMSFAGLVVSRLVHRLRNQSTHDALTGLFNRRAMDERLLQHWERWRRGGEGFSVALLDLDFFKRVNDTLGHGEGDQVLVRTARWLAAEVRGADVVARVGGEEFLVLMPGANGPAALVLAERLRAGLAALQRAAPTGAPALTVSIGVAEAGDADAGPDGLLRRADEALYRAKAAGRDRVVLAP